MHMKASIRSSARLACLGVSAFHHDSAAALVTDGDIIAAAQEERFWRVKHDARLAVAAIAGCLTQGGVRARDIDIVALSREAVEFTR